MQDEPDAIRPTDLAAKLNVSVAYASQLLSGTRIPSLELALRMLDISGVRLGPLVGATDEEIATLRKLAA
jgi:transcriptional regulator with XRE-family HTH domain